jgi:uncharacterized RmlC-like cupin family protein
MSESFFVVSGTVQLFNGERWIDATPGDFLHVPEGGVHGFRNDSPAPASMLILFAPGAPRFSPRLPRVVSLAKRNGRNFVAATTTISFDPRVGLWFGF